MPSLRNVPGLALVALLVLPGVAGAQSKSNQGSSLSAAANYPYHCDYRWTAGYGGQPGGFGPGGYQEYEPQYIAPSTCTILHLGINGRVDTSHLVPGTGTVTVARVKSGPDPAPISIATIRSYQGRDQQGQYSDTCCQGVSETETVNPTPNAITEIPVNFRVEAVQFDPNSGRAGWHDFVAVNVHGSTGTLPMHDDGQPKPFGPSRRADDYNTLWYFPQIDPSQHNQNRWDAPGFEVLMNYDWCPASTTARARATQAGCPSAPPGGGGTQEPTAPPPENPVVTEPVQTTLPATVRSSRLVLRGSTVAVRVRCTTTQTCAGVVRLRTRSPKRTLGSRRVRIAPNTTATVKVRLSASNRRRVTRRGLRVTVEVDLGSTGEATRNVILRRGR